MLGDGNGLPDQELQSMTNWPVGTAAEKGLTTVTEVERAECSQSQWPCCYGWLEVYFYEDF